MKQLFFKHSLRRTILSLTIFCVLIPMAITSVYFYGTMERQFSEQKSRDMFLFLEQINEKINAQVKMIDDTATLIRTNQTILSCLTKEQVAEDHYGRILNRLEGEKALLYCSTLSFSGVAASDRPAIVKRVYVFRDNNEYYKFRFRYDYREDALDLQHQKLYQSMKASTSDGVLLPPSSEDDTIYVGHPIKDLEEFEEQGWLLMDLDASMLGELYKGLQEYAGARWYLLDSDATVLSAPNRSLFGSRAPIELRDLAESSSLQTVSMDGIPYLCTVKKTGEYGLTSVILVPEAEILGNLGQSMTVYLYIIFAILLGSLVIGLYASFKITQPLRDMTKRIQGVAQGDFSVRMPDYRYLELAQVGDVFNGMAGKIDYLITEVYQKQLLLKEAELHSLRAQINPHFLFNVFQTIAWFAQAGRNEDVYNMIVVLGEIMHASISESNEEKISIHDELHYTGLYIAMQKYRFEERLQYEFQLESPELEHYLIPKFCLQPIVENAIVHGIEEKIGVGHLRLDIFAQEGDILFEITDDGVGFDSAAMHWDSPPPAEPLSDSRHLHIGLYNSNKRIQLLYGEKYGIRIRSERGVGTTVLIRIPMDKGGMKDV